MPVIEYYLKKNEVQIDPRSRVEHNYICQNGSRMIPGSCQQKNFAMNANSRIYES